MSGLAEAQQRAGFAPVNAAKLGAPAAVFVHRFFHPQAIGLVFNSPTFGPFQVLEDPAGPDDQAMLENLAATCHPETGCEGSWKMIALPDGQSGLLIANPDVSNGILWVQRGLRFDAFGPSSTFSVADATTVANALSVAVGR